MNSTSPKQQAILDIKDELAHENKAFIAFNSKLDEPIEKITEAYIKNMPANN